MIFSGRVSRPIIIAGAGSRGSGIKDFAGKYGIPVAATWAALDMFPEGLCFGTHGTRYGNFAVQNADWILSVGSRLDTKATGTPIESFAPKAMITMIDIDQREISKFGIKVYGVCRDSKDIDFDSEFKLDGDFSAWRERISSWKSNYPVIGPQYDLIRKISDETPEDTIVCTDTGCAVAWVSQVWKWKKGQRFIHAFNQTPMGYGLPAALGSHYATGWKVVLVTGDGSLMMSIGELATIKGLPIKIHLLDNKGHAMCRQTQREWLGSRYPATSLEGGLKFPNWRKGCNWFDVDLTIHEIDPDWDVVPKVKANYPNHDAHPLLDRKELAEQMA